MNATCPTCGTTYRIDPAKVPPAGVRARCTRCEAVFRVAPERAEAAPADATAPPPAPEPQPDISPAPPSDPEARSDPETPAPPPFGVADPQGKARRLARALVSDIVVYHPDRRERGLRNGTLRQEFREEIRKSWDEYVGQVGEALALGTPYFRDALNEILAGGKAVF